MVSRWPIRNKLILWLALLAVIVTTLAWSGFHSVYAYRGLAKTLGRRSVELPLASRLAQQVSDWRISLRRASPLDGLRFEPVADESVDRQLLREDFHNHFQAVQQTLAEFRGHLEETDNAKAPINDNRFEWQTVERLDHALASIRSADADQDWILDAFQMATIDGILGEMQTLTGELPRTLHEKFRQFSLEARRQYRALIYFMVVICVLAGVLLALWLHLFYRWVLRPLRVILQGSRRVAAGHFEYVIHLETHDEMAELAQAMNDMTARFRAIRDDLDRQVQERTKQVVRSEQLASVGFLAAGVAHEINNPLASIALCAESLEGRLGERDAASADPQLVRNYLRMIQEEAFRCKEITEKLLDFSRLGQVQRQPTELRALLQDVLDMLGHLGKYQDHDIQLEPGPPVVAMVSTAEIKQVVLNLVANALDSLDPGGWVHVSLWEHDEQAEIVVSDNGCGMTDEVLQHLFEPFFTRRRGGQGIGLGLSITYRIVTEHGGHIEASSPGPGRGSQFRVSLPLARHERKEPEHRYQAA